MENKEQETPYLELPDIIELSEYGGNFAVYLEAVYDKFQTTF